MSRKVLLVGDGAVGSTFANDLLQHVDLDELVICDVAKDRPVGDSMDLEDITPFVGETNIHPGEGCRYRSYYCWCSKKTRRN